ncbi:MAG: hypothetical protein AAF329_21710, partial [Cyanobacteria bacterium P01_A01_bin.17]
AHCLKDDAGWILTISEGTINWHSWSQGTVRLSTYHLNRLKLQHSLLNSHLYAHSILFRQYGRNTFY